MDNVSMVPLASIVCITYNHEAYIRECLNGFLKQRTTFKFEVLVHDDASTDNTAKIIREYEEKYPSLFRVIYQTKNQYSQGVRPCEDILFPIANGKYIALCEGDDYWIDPYKLQKQVDHLEANMDYGLCYTQTRVYNQDKRQDEGIFGGPYEDFEKIIIHNPIPTLTVVARTDLLRQYVREINPSVYNWKLGDYPIWLWMSCHSKISYIPEITSCYRVNGGSMSHAISYISQLEFIKSVIDVKQFFIQYKPLVSQEIIDLINIESIQTNLQLAYMNHNVKAGKILKQKLWAYISVKQNMVKRLKLWLLLLCPGMFTKLLQWKFNRL